MCKSIFNERKQVHGTHISRQELVSGIKVLWVSTGNTFIGHGWNHGLNPYILS
jgi:hypothetical protein